MFQKRMTFNATVHHRVTRV